ncbi:MAG: 23S rRNA (pseudouridine(1915)-N(3))-methyltransferase RlmH [Terriglobia bacterium]
MKIRVIWEGRTRNEHFQALQNDYTERISRFIPIKVEEARGSSGMARMDGSAKDKLTPFEERLIGKTHDCFTVLLDPRGEGWTSEQFAEWLGRQATHGTKGIAFVVGGAEGFSGPFRQRADLLLALSRMTLTHDWARTLLLEQIYRGFAILRGYPYAR